MDKDTGSCDKMAPYIPTRFLVFWNAFPSLGLLVFTTCIENICRYSSTLWEALLKSDLTLQLTMTTENKLSYKFMIIFFPF